MAGKDLNKEKEMWRVELYERIRKDNRDEGLSIRALADKYHVHRRTVREAPASGGTSGAQASDDAPRGGGEVISSSR